MLNTLPTVQVKNPAKAHLSLRSYSDCDAYEKSLLLFLQVTTEGSASPS